MTVAFSDPISHGVIKRQKSKVHYLRTKSEKPSLADDQIRWKVWVAKSFRPYLVEIESLESNFLVRIDAHTTNGLREAMKDTQ